MKVTKVIDDIVRIIRADYTNILDHVNFGLDVVNKKLVEGKTNWQSYVLTPVSNTLAKSGYKVYTHILGVSVAKLPESILENVKKGVEWCDTCNDIKGCLEEEAETEIDAFVFGDNEEKACVIEHASDIGSLCWDMVKLCKFITSRKGFSSCLFLTWVDTNDTDHRKMMDVTTSLGKILFDNLIGSENWEIIYIPYVEEENFLFNKTFYTKSGSQLFSS